ncbi:uncharacterized protein LOC6539031 [Drosophila yakuba]|uniref:Uncharacterized protein n=1 Tax=Drosophila yakuba TaxID=7245 RepID=B4PP09_DROYA|nr:uncharacterized protein LOC6539031 [Drosophila yakuba]EDW99245.1 uncharacterized protein Dyak_GE23307 [Drosophila yakuba]
MEIHLLLRWIFGCLVIVQGLSVVPAEPLPAPHQESLASEPDLLASGHGEPLEQQSILVRSKREFDDNGEEIVFKGPLSDTKDRDCGGLRYGPTTQGGQAQLTASWLVCIPIILFLTRLVRVVNEKYQLRTY